MLIFIVFSCSEANVEDSGDTGEQISTNTAQFAISWQEDGIGIEIAYGDSGVWWFGIAETEGDSPWTGEDCSQGGLLNNGETISWCHPLSLQGGFLRFGGDPEALSIGEETAMSIQSSTRQPMYYFINVMNSECAIGGAGATEYATLCDNTVQIAVEEPTQ